MFTINEVTARKIAQFIVEKADKNQTSIVHLKEFAIKGLPKRTADIEAIAEELRSKVNVYGFNISISYDDKINLAEFLNKAIKIKQESRNDNSVIYKVYFTGVLKILHETVGITLNKDISNLQFYLDRLADRNIYVAHATLLKNANKSVPFYIVDIYDISGYALISAGQPRHFNNEELIKLIIQMAYYLDLTIPKPLKVTEIIKYELLEATNPDNNAGSGKILTQKKDRPGKKRFTGEEDRREKIVRAVANNYVGKKVPRKYQKKYGKIYNEKEAKRVGYATATNILGPQKRNAFAGKLRKMNEKRKNG